MPRVRVNRICGNSRSKMRINRISSNAARKISDVLGVRASDEQTRLRVKPKTKVQRNRRKRKLTQNRSRQSNGLAPQPKPRLDDLFPRIDVVLILASQKLAHLRVHAIDVGSQRQNRQQRKERNAYPGLMLFARA